MRVPEKVRSLGEILSQQAARVSFIRHRRGLCGSTQAPSNVSGFRQRNSIVPSLNTALTRASSDTDVRHRVTFNGGWDLPFDNAWESGPKRLTQGWSLFPIVTWRTGFPIDVAANLPDAFNNGTESTSGVGDPFVVRAKVVGPLNTFDPRSPANIQRNERKLLFQSGKF
jgi:hypothetical protein